MEHAMSMTWWLFDDEQPSMVEAFMAPKGRHFHDIQRAHKMTCSLHETFVKRKADIERTNSLVLVHPKRLYMEQHPPMSKREAYEINERNYLNMFDMMIADENPLIREMWRANDTEPIDIFAQTAIDATGTRKPQKL